MFAKELPGHPGVHRSNLEVAGCHPGGIHLRQWGLTKGPQEPFLGSQFLDGIAARVLHVTHARFKDQNIPTSDLCWLGMSMTRILEDNKFLDGTMDAGELVDGLNRLVEDGFLDNQDGIYFPTAELVQRIVRMRYRPSPNWREMQTAAEQPAT